MLGNRIHRARKALGLSLRDLAEQVALSHAAIKKYEDNEVTPSSDILIKLAKALHVKVEYFFRPERFTLEKIQYRKHADMPEKQLEEIKAKMLDQIERRIELESLFPSPPIEEFSLGERKIKSYDDIESVANQIRKQWKLGLEPLPDLIDIFEEHGIKVFEIDNELYPKFDGLSASINNMPIIVIGNQWPGDRQRFTLAHELGHLVLNGFFTPASLDNEEKYCNRFAGAFLLPKEALISILGEHRNYIEPRELSLLKQEFGISMQGILHRAEDIGIISNSLYLQLRSEFNERGWSKREPGEQYPKEETHIFEQMIFHALAEEYIGESKAAELMNMPLESFRSLRAMESQDVVHHQ
jgi:Zn-dependent peptidase ImmA (M78 family)/DNA-binding XRE family transcriptional regulator